MKKRLYLPLALIIVTLFGCSVKEPDLECISDHISPISQPAFYITSDIRAGTFLSSSCDDGCCALFSHEDYEIVQEVFHAEDLDAAFFHLTGQVKENLKPVKVSSYSREGYRYAWTATGEDGMLICSGALFQDGNCFYALSFLCQADQEKEYREIFSEILSSMELSPV